MGETDSAIDILHKLGLTLLEAKVYTTLATSENADAKTVAKTLNIAKCEAYRALASLEKLGLTEKLLTIPTVYQAVPIKDASRILLENKTLEYLRLQKDTEKLVTNLDRTIFASIEDSEQNIVISEGKIVTKRLVNQLLTAQSSFETVSTWNVCAKMLCEWSNDLKVLTKNGVNVCVLTDNFPKENASPPFLVDLQKSPFFEIRYYKKPLTLKMAIRDRKEVNVCFSEKRSSPSVWSKNPIFAQLATKCFECMWNEAAPNKKQADGQCQALPTS